MPKKELRNDSSSLLCSSDKRIIYPIFITDQNFWNNWIWEKQQLVKKREKLRQKLRGILIVLDFLGYQTRV